MPNTQYGETNRGVLFPNDKKTPGSRQPDYRGTLDVDGATFNVAAWIQIVKKEGKNRGKEFLSLKIESLDQSQTDEHQSSKPYLRQNSPATTSIPQGRNLPVREDANPFNDEEEAPF